jgi:hypothetical protein
VLPPDSLEKLKYPLRDKKPYEVDGKRHPLDLSDPAVIKDKYQLDPERYRYDRSTKIGNLDYKLPSSNSVANQIKQDGDKSNKDYFRQRAQAQNNLYCFYRHLVLSG